MELRNIAKANLKTLLNGDLLRKGKMLIISWPRLTDKKKRINGAMQVIETAGSFIRRRCILRSDWEKATPSGSFQPKGGNMFNVATQEQVNAIKANHQLYLFLSLEGITHPQGEKDHPVNVPLDRVTEIQDTADKIVYRVVE